MTELAYHITDYGRNKRMLAIPESHMLYLCPQACGRRQGIRAIRNGIEENTSFLQFSEEDIISGDYETVIYEAVGSLVEMLPKKPRVISLFVNCIDDLLGTDSEALVSYLQTSYDDINFTLSHVNPLSSDINTLSAKTSHTRLYELLQKPQQLDDGLTLVGNFEPLPLDSEFVSLMPLLGVTDLRQLCACTRYEDYLRLGTSKMVISLSHLGDKVADDIEERLGIPSFLWHASYSVEDIKARYQRLALELHSDPLDISILSCQTQRAIKSARESVGDTPLIVDSSASMQPFTLALNLLEYGFRVTTIFALHMKDSDEDARLKILRDYPHLTFIYQGSHEAIRGYDISSECIALGMDAAFLLRARHFVDMYHDEGFFGFEGIIKLMNLIKDAQNKTFMWVESRAYSIEGKL